MRSSTCIFHFVSSKTFQLSYKAVLYSSQPACPSDDAYSVSKLSDFTPPVYDETLLSIRTKTARQQEALRRHGMPDHWSAPRDNIGKLVFNTLCLMSFGHAGLEPLWGAIILEEEGDESVWAEQTRQTIDRLTNINVVAGLLLTSCATFITTFPPRPDMINYTLRGPYLCLLGSFALLIGGLIVGSAWVLVTGKTRPHWAKEACYQAILHLHIVEKVLYANRFHVYCTLATLSYPFISIGTATMILSFGKCKVTIPKYIGSVY
ncbi:hypothetical protein GYMLUDRAFT_153325 [Collybiopsis luxurians FD-317 M1]|nr:hypothetical protein GYMLUDRAFT_153325 [Collybiopsis luxurians FD-317 M1]